MNRPAVFYDAMKFNLPKIKRGESKTNAAPAPEAEEILDELDAMPEPEPAPESKKPQSYGMVITEAQLRMIWAGEISFGLLMALAAVVIALIN